MTRILCIESGTTTCSVALGYGKDIVDVIETHEKEYNHAKNLSLFVSQILAKQNLKASDLSAVAISKGPGSYTGLRIGASVAKGICYGANIPLISVGSLKAMTNGAIQWLKERGNTNPPNYICPMIDARRMEVFTQLFEITGDSISDVEAIILDDKSFSDILKKGSILFLGNGSFKAKDVIKSSKAFFIDRFNPSASFMLPLATKKFEEEQFENTAYFEPFYLKDFVAIKPRNKVLGNLN